MPAPAMKYQAMATEAVADQGFQESQLFEYHLYTLGRRTDLPDQSTKQLELFPAVTGAGCRRELVFTATPSYYNYGAAMTDQGFGATQRGEAGAFLEFENREANRLGIPLPGSKAPGALRLLRGSRRGRLLVDRERYPVGGTVMVRLIVPEAGGAGRTATCRVVAPDGSRTAVTLTAEPGRSDVLRGSFVATREGGWQIDADLGGGADEPLGRRIQAHLPDRELAQPRIDRGLLEELAAATGGRAWFLHDTAWTPESARELAAKLPDRSRREYEAGAPDRTFKQRLNGILLAVAAGMLCSEWILRRLAKLA
jgi:hypothetical protein